MASGWVFNDTGRTAINVNSGVVLKLHKYKDKWIVEAYHLAGEAGAVEELGSYESEEDAVTGFEGILRLAGAVVSR